MQEDAVLADLTAKDLAALRGAVTDLRDSKRRLTAAQDRLDDPQLVMELERLVAERQKALDRIVRALDDEMTRVEVTRAVRARREPGPPSTAARGGETVVSSLVHRETSTIDTLRHTLGRDLPDPVEDALRSALTQVGRSRDQLQLVGPDGHPARSPHV